MKGGSRFESVLIVTNNPSHARMDKETLLSIGCQSITIHSKGKDAFLFFRSRSVDIILCDWFLNDMAGPQFVRALRMRKEGRNVPVIMVTAENRRKKVLDAISAGCTGYILRPYSQVTMDRQLRQARQMENFGEIEELQLEEAKELVDQGRFDEAIESLEEIVSDEDESRRYYEMGMDYLLKNLYGKAIIAFKKALKANDLLAEAYKGMAEAYKAKGNEDAYKDCLNKAAETAAALGNMEETKELFITILKYEDSPANPFNTLGVKLRRKKDYEGAINAYRKALELTPEDENIHFNLARAYTFTNDQRQAMSSLLQALDLNNNFKEAQAMYKSITGKAYVPRVPSVARSGGPTSELDN